MRAAAASAALTRHTQMCDITAGARRLSRKAILPMAVLISVETMYLFFSGRPGAESFGMIGAGSLIMLVVWNTRAIGLPLLPLFALQNLAVYGAPIALGHEVMTKYPEAYITKAGIEVLLFDVVMMVGWVVAMQMFVPARPYSHVLKDVNREGVSGVSRLGFLLISSSTAYQVLSSLGFADILLNLLPNGTASIIVAMVAATSACGLFMVSLGISAGGEARSQRVAFWILLAVNSLISASSFLLSATALNLFAVAIGLFWGSGRIPWRYLFIISAALAFLNIGKFAMRDRYWGRDPDEPPPEVGLLQIPNIFMEWSETSLDLLTGAQGARAIALRGPENPVAAKNQTMLDRIDNIQNLLFVIDAMDDKRITPLYGATYVVIPSLLVPRIFWPDKPRTHEGQVLLNVHFERQDLNSTFTTYVAWGLLPEAYGNFGQFSGSALLGLFMGMLFGWIENITARKAVISLEGFLAFDLLLNLVNSFEMVASVLVTATFQSMVPIIAACWPFVVRQKVEPPESDQA